MDGERIDMRANWLHLGRAVPVAGHDYRFKVGDAVVLNGCGGGHGEVARHASFVSLGAGLKRTPAYDLVVSYRDRRGRPVTAPCRCGEGILEPLHAFLARHAEHGSTYDEVMTSLRRKWEAAREYNRKVAEGFLMGDGHGI